VASPANVGPAAARDNRRACSSLLHAVQPTGIVAAMEPGDLGLLVTLDALLQEGSVTKAAQRLGLSTPAMSHALARIRDKLGDPLLVRAGRGMVLTPRAEQLKPRVHEVVAGAAQVLAPAQPFAPRSLARGFAILATDHVLLVLGRELDALLRAEAPGVDLRFIPNSPDDPEALRRGAADLAVGIYGELPPEMRTRPLLTDRHVCVVRDGHPEVGARLTLDQYTRLQHVQIAPRGAPGGYVDDVLRGLGRARRVARAVPFFGAALHLVAETDYLLTVPERAARAMAPRFGLRLLEPPIELRPYALGLLWHPRFDADEGHRWLREALIRAARVRASDAHRGARTRLDPPARKRKT
jgi:DNA-binding transcriptional LysR family regulator